jgi:hypothetical protein
LIALSNLPEPDHFWSIRADEPHNTMALKNRVDGGRSEFGQDIAKFETPGRACRQAVPEWPVFAHSARLVSTSTGHCGSRPNSMIASRAKPVDAPKEAGV